MDWKDRDSAIIKLLFKNELAIGYLYDAYAKMFPTYKDFWSSLSAEEADHALLISKLFSRIKDGFVHFDKSRFRLEALRAANCHLNDLLAEAKQGEISMTKALSKALEIEKSMIEREFFGVFYGDSPQLTQILMILRESTEEHVAKIHTLYMEEKENESQPLSDSNLEQVSPKSI